MKSDQRRVKIASAVEAPHFHPLWGHIVLVAWTLEMALCYLFFLDNFCQNPPQCVNSREQLEIQGHFSQQILLQELVPDYTHYLFLEIDHYNHLRFAGCFSVQPNAIFRNKI